MEPSIKPLRPAIARVAREAADHLDEQVASSDTRARARDAFLANVASTPEGDLDQGLFARLLEEMRGWVTWRFALVALVGTAVALALLVTPPVRPTPLSFTVAGAKGSVGGWIGSRGEGPVALAFSDGSRFELDRGTDARVAATDTKGARVVLERGKLHAEVVHTGKSAWSVGVGPFDVRVTGTKFDVAWDPEEQRLSLDLIEGSVVVAGCARAEQNVRAGESLNTSCAPDVPPPLPLPLPLPVPVPVPVPAPANGMAETASNPLPGSSPSPLPSPSTSTSALTTASSVPPSALTAKPPTWTELAASGRYREALSLVQSDYDARCASMAPGDLLLLADVARYAGDSARAKQAWLALRTRFPGDSRAASAAFFLGRAAFEGAEFNEAKKWFGVSVAEAPSGTLAREAHGRLIEACQRAGDPEGAKKAARKYLTEYPTGPHARLAESVAGN
jgi:transmembrane sensor